MIKYSPAPIQFDVVADLYDRYVTTQSDLPFWLKEAQSAKGKVLELACGTGRVSVPLLQAGIKLTCVDYAPGMLSVLRGKLQAYGLSCPVYCQDISELSLPDRFELVLIPFHSFSEILDRERQRTALLRIYDHLEDHGHFVCCLQNPEVRKITLNGIQQPVGKFSMEGGNTLVVQSLMTFDDSTGIATGEQEYDVISSDGSLVERRSLNVSFYLFRKEEFENLASEAGFEVLALYGDYEYHPFETAASPSMVWRLKKKTGR